MTEQEYEKLVEERSRRHADNLHTMNCHQPEWLNTRRDFLAGIKWARENPAPEVLALVEHGQSVIGYMEDSGIKNVDPSEPEFQFYTATVKLLARFKERTAGKGEG